MAVDLLRDVEWELHECPPGSIEHPKALTGELAWLPATVPGTAAGALRAAGEADWRSRDYDASDWWFRARFAAETTTAHTLTIGGLATVGEVWLNGELLWTTQSMFVGTTVEVPLLARENELVVRCAALAPVLAERRPRGRWRTALVAAANLRHVRTTLLGRMPGWAGQAPPVGPYRPITLTPRSEATVQRRLSATVEGADGLLRGTLLADHDPGPATLVAGVQRLPVRFETDEDGWSARFDVRLPGVELWWPHTHGDQPRYALRLETSAAVHDLGTVAFRSVTLDTSDGGFTLSVNGVEVFCRGAVWMPLDPIAVTVPAEQTRAAVLSARAANLNMLRVPGTTFYEGADFFEACDELGVLVWQDCMLANLDPSEEPAVLAGLADELEQLCVSLQGRPSLAVLSGGSEVEQQAAMSGVARERWHSRVLDEVIPGLVAQWLPELVTIASSPTRGALPFVNDVGVAHYFGVGAYLRPLEDARRSGVRFAAECLAFAIPPETAVGEHAASPVVGGPAWKAAVPRDAGASWDFDDVRDHYVRDLFGVDAATLLATDPWRYLDLGRAAVVECVTATFSEWRRSDSPCAGALVLSLRDLVPGAGWGLTDASGRPKAAWFALRRVLAPVALLATDEGLNGLRLHCVNDTATDLDATLRLRLFVAEHAVEQVELPVLVPARGGAVVDTAGAFDGFRDLTAAYGFGPSPYSAVLAELLDASGRVLGDVVWVPGPRDVTPDPDLGLRATLCTVDGQPVIVCTARHTARWVSLHVTGGTVADSWFHLAPGVSRSVAVDAAGEITGTISAVNGVGAAQIQVEATR
ncbi:hypothetical protein [Jatrophihabitans sp.]|uniref:glycosyl hydrolase 2 galactose-binding domain-containing protein n=1 Tax=Jatrophihabitans sp. TaxID=1932789 RepID=UPI0030C6EC9D|nr:O-glycosyl hydrolase [Jatrophihabitans sp.]